MKLLSKICFVLIISVLTIQNSRAQREQDTIKTDRLIITKQYSPTLNDAFKIKTKPDVSEETQRPERTINYPLISVPVASTFQPVKGRAASLKKSKEQFDPYNHYVRVGLGNYTNLLADYIGNFQLNNKQSLGIDFSHFSSQGGINEAYFDDAFARNELAVDFESDEGNWIWKTNAGFEHFSHNYYGESIFQEEGFMFNPNYSPTQNYLGFNFGASADLYNSFLDRVQLNYHYFSDDFDASEHQMDLSSDFHFNLGGKDIHNQFGVKYLSGEFSAVNNGFAYGQDLPFEQNYGQLITSYAPSIFVEEDRFTLQLGAEVVFFNDAERSENELYFYPKVEANYRVIPDNLIAYAGVDGGLDQNSFRDFAHSNPFISSTLNILPTHRQYESFVGIKGNSGQFSYNTRISYKNEDARALFRNNFGANPLLFEQADQIRPFEAGNSFGVIYDDLQTLAFDVEANYDLTKDFNLGLTFNYSAFNTDQQEEAWNLPSIYTSLIGSYQLNKKWTLGASLFYVGERKDFESFVLDSEQVSKVVNVDAFVDLSLNVQYRINNQLSAFLMGNNLVGGNYERWNNYQVQGLQVMGGISYQFK